MFIKFKIKLCCALACIISAACLFTSCNQSEKQENALTLGTQSAYPPFEYLHDNGDIVGFDVDVARLIAKKLNRPLVIEDMEFEGLILSLKQGKIDMVMAGMDISESRLKEIAMIPYHGDATTSFTLIFWGPVPSEVHSIEDIAKLPHGMVSVESGSTPELYLERHPEIPKKSFQGALAGVLDVRYGKSTANLVQTDVAEFLKKKYPEIQVLEVPLTSKDAVLGFGIGIRKNNEKLIQQVQQAVSELKSTGELKDLEKKWFEGDLQ